MNNPTSSLFAFHLLNDRSGSPKVLSQLLKIWTSSGAKNIHLYTSPHQNGFLSDIQGIQYHWGWYQFKQNPWLRLLYYTLSQAILMLKMWNKITKNDLVYVNTVLPFGAALLGKIKGAKVIYHIHESSVSPAVLKWFLFGIVRFTATEIINVSKYVQQQHNICSVPNRIVYNTIEDSYLEKMLPKKPAEPAQNVLMICSLKVYKGVFEFLQLAKDNPQFYFRLVLNAKQEDINDFFRDCVIPDNLLIYPAQQDVHIFYQWADIIVNLSRPDGWIETFGLTIIEGMAYKLPAVVPPVGGILEVIEEGVSGCGVDSRNRQQLNETLRYILQNNNRYQMMSEAAKKRLELFKEAKMRAVLSYSTLIN